MPEFHYNDGTAWRKVKEYHYNDGTAWRKAKEIWYNDGTAWRLAFKAETVSFNSRVISTSAASAGSTTATSQIQFLANGTLQSVSSGTGLTTTTTPYTDEWLKGSSNGTPYEIFASIVSGTLTSGTTGSWLPLSANQIWIKTISSTTTSSGSVVISFQIRDAATTTVLASNNITLSADVE